jgi:HK97 family phage portal protein
VGIIKSIFGNTKLIQTYSRWKELGKYDSVFNSFGDDIYKSEIVRSCIRPLAEHSSKANVKCTDKRIERILNVNPNPYMNGKDFLYKVRTKLEIKNTAFIYIGKDDTGKVISFYPVPYSYFEAVEYANGLFIKFYFMGAETRSLVLPWEDLAVVRKDYNDSDISGDDNNSILGMLELISTTNQGIANAVKATANLRGILKSTKAMLAPEAIKQQKDDFVKDYLNLGNEGGIASLDATQEFTPIKMEPTITNYAQMKEFRENVYRYFNISDAIVMSDYTEAQMEAFYEARIEPFLVALSLELTRKVFSKKAQGYDNHIVYEANRLQFATMSTKVTVFKEVVLYGGMTINEWRQGCNMAPLPDGDVPIRRLDAATVDENKPKEETEETEPKQEGDSENE